MIKPMLCGLKKPADIQNVGFLFERKYDGERAIIEITKGKRFIYARSGREKNRMYPDLDIDVKCDCILDGEIAATDGKFNSIQHRANRENGIKEAAKMYPVMYHCFDVLNIGGKPVDGLRLDQRKNLLGNLLTPNPTCEIAPTYTDGLALFQDAETKGMEGIVGKRISSPYGFGARGEYWIKVKCLKRDTFWVVGYTTGTGWRIDTFGSMVLAKLDITNTKFIPVGEVGTGFDQQELQKLDAQLKSSHLLAQTEFFKYPGPITWVRPFQVVIEFLELTADGRIRFPSYKGTV